MLKFNFKNDLYTGEKIDLGEYRKMIYSKLNRKSGIYFSEISKLYHEEKYNKPFEFIVSEFYNIPRCPITNDPVKFKYSGTLKFSNFSKKASNSEIQKYNSKHNEKVINFHNKLKVERKGEKNPAYGNKAWNNGLTKENNDIIKNISLSRKGKNIYELLGEKAGEVKQKLSKKRKENIQKGIIGGMLGKEHSKETCKKLRDITIQRLKNGKFPQTNTYINKFVERILIENNIEYEKEFKYGHFSFDFKVDKFLIEVQGDYWHWNQNNPTFKNKKLKSRRIINNLARDKSKKTEVISKNEFQLIEIWEYDINNNPKEIELCLKKLLNQLN